jgi:hypothetical protein
MNFTLTRIHNGPLTERVLHDLNQVAAAGRSRVLTIRLPVTGIRYPGLPLGK